MPSVVATILLCLFASAWAQDASPRRLATPESLSLESALEEVLEVDSAVVTARANLVSAERERMRVRADPLALRLLQLRTENALDNARAALRIQQWNARSQAAEAYFKALEADADLELRLLQRQQASIRYEANRIRFEAGAITQLELEASSNAFTASQRARIEAEEARDLAYQELTSLLGRDHTPLQLQALETLPAVPALNNLSARLEQNQQLRSAEQALDIARIEYEQANNAFVARAVTQERLDAFERARLRIPELRRELSLSLRQRYNALLLAQGRLAGEEEALRAAQEQLHAEQLRFDAGAISVLELEQARFAYAEQYRALSLARHSIYRAWLSVEQTVLGSP